MSFYYTKAIRLKRNGRVSVTVACNNVRPLTYWTEEYGGSLTDLLVSIQEGNFQLLNNQGLRKFNHVTDAVNRIIRDKIDKEGVTWDAEYEFRLNDRAKIVRFICDEFARRLEKDDWANTALGTVLETRLEEMVSEARKNIEAARQDEKDRGIISISCAALSIFEDKDGVRYDLLMPKGEDNFVLAPTNDYRGGKLQTSDKVIQLGTESRDMYAFLSFDGLGCSLTEYIEKCPGKEDVIKARFAAVSACVDGVLDKGLRLITGKEPYTGYKAAA